MTRRAAALACAIGLSATASAAARTLEVGNGKPYAAPSDAIAAAADGDTVAIDAGEYFDCAIVHASGLTIEGLGAGATLTDRTCEDKALLVIRGDRVTVRNMTLTRARVPDQNGAGIRAEGNGLTVDHVRFVNDESGLMAAPMPASAIRIIDSDFEDVGKCNDARCSDAILVGRIASLQVERSKFAAPRAGAGIESHANQTLLVGNDMSDGPDGVMTPFVSLPEGGDLTMRDNAFRVGPHTSSSRIVVGVATSTGLLDSSKLVFEHNRLENQSGQRVTFVLNLSNQDGVYRDNRYSGDVTEESSRGRLWSRLRAAAHQLIDFLKHVAASALRLVGLRS